MTGLLTPGSPLAPPLPSSLTSFIGREREVAAVSDLIASARLVTLTGAGGSGKTRLAAEVTRSLEGRFRDGIAWIELLGVSEPSLVIGHVAASLGVGGAGRAPADALRDAMRDSDRLIVLDNCEHVLDACVAVVDLVLRHCPEIRVLATSREALGISGERAWLVPLLSVPKPDDTADAALNAESVRLFVERARAANASFALTEANADAVARLCRRLDGLPLALELAAARARDLTPEQMVTRLERDDRLLSEDRPGAGTRHRTLRDTIDWSYDLLDPMERVLLHRISVFAAEFSLDVAEAVCAGDGIEQEAVLDLLAALVDKSLVVTDDRVDEVRYHLLETIRHYGRERLEASGGHEVVRSRHADFYSELIRTAEPHFITPDRPVWVARIERELDDIRAVLVWTRTSDPARHAELAGRLAWFWYSSGLWTEGRQWLEDALPLASEHASEATRATVLFGAGVIAALQGHGQVARSWLEEASALAQSLGDRALGAYADSYIGVALGQEGLPAAEAPTRAALEWFEQAGDLYGQRLALVILATLLVRQGDLPAARAVAEEAVRVARAYGLGRELGIALQILGTVRLHQRELDAAAAAFADALRALRNDPQGFWIARALELFGVVECARSRPTHAARLFGAAERRRERMGAVLFRLDRERLAPTIAAARASAGDAAFDAAWAAGRAQTFDSVVDLAIEAAGRDSSGAPESGADGAAGGGGAPSNAALQVRVLGRLELLCDGRSPTHAAWKYARPRELFAYLLSHVDGRTREQIRAAMWPDASAAQAKNNFHVTLHHLRRALGRADIVVFENDRYAINRSIGVEVDAEVFERDLSAARQALRASPSSSDAARLLRAALDLYRGDFLADDGAGDWHLERRDHLHRSWIEGLIALGSHLSAVGAHADAVDVYRRLVRADELDETAHRHLISALAAAGHRGEALRHYERLVALLEREVGSPPSRETVLLRERIRKGDGG
jgi:predicted ATPase/DNA-binding SARP family transcriptional activator